MPKQNKTCILECQKYYFQCNYLIFISIAFNKSSKNAAKMQQKCSKKCGKNAAKIAAKMRQKAAKSGKSGKKRQKAAKKKRVLFLLGSASYVALPNRIQ